jgi:hypothetical protein
MHRSFRCRPARLLCDEAERANAVQTHIRYSFWYLCETALRKVLSACLQTARQRIRLLILYAEIVEERLCFRLGRSQGKSACRLM